ncbi:uncharacterized protein B0H64DRAFT_54598 [Chaetomium fimeti]|uniref:Uncharacterized protein n=1 Tax=Chaetomium fimeti TaxID=1854472 RepID=A0AAE0H679_9PEZI|nr:hypothetical protein B0H64DRAFT_54598 [Chaetomium fimeti]
METTKKSRFFSLPPEIRNMIYKTVVVKAGNLLVMSHGPSNALTLFPVGQKRGPWLALLRTNRAIHKEASGILYGCNTFAPDGPLGRPLPVLSRFLDCIGPVNVAHLPTMSVGFLDMVTPNHPGDQEAAFGELVALRRCTGLKTLSTHSGV